MHDSEKKHQCNICKKYFCREDLLKCHMAIHNRQPLLRCEQCNKSFFTRAGYKHHKVMHLAKMGVPACSFCSATFESQELLAQHKKNHTKHRAKTANPIFHCPHCPRKFCYQAMLSKHIDNHNTPIIFCPYCHRHFKTNIASLMTHLKKVHNKPLNPEKLQTSIGQTAFQCKDCLRVYRLEYKFNNHLRHHKKNVRFKCNYCPLWFTNQISLLNHAVSLHSTELNLTDASASTSNTQPDAPTTDLQLDNATFDDLVLADNENMTLEDLRMHCSTYDNTGFPVYDIVQDQQQVHNSSSTVSPTISEDARVHCSTYDQQQVHNSSSTVPPTCDVNAAFTLQDQQHVDNYSSTVPPSGDVNAASTSSATSTPCLLPSFESVFYSLFANISD